MSHPIAIIRLAAGTEYNGTYTHNRKNYIGKEQSYKKFRLQTGVLAHLRNSGIVRFIQLSRVGVRGWAYLNHEDDLARAAAEHHRSQEERYRQAQRQQAANGQWYLGPRAFEKFVGISYTTRYYWHEHGIPILDGEELDTLDFADGNGERTPFYSECQAKRVVKARATASIDQLVPANLAAQRCRVNPRLVRQLAKESVIEAELRSAQIGRQSQKRYFVSLSGLRQELQNQRQAKKFPPNITDPISVKEAARLCRVHHATINKWVRAEKIRHTNVGHLNHQGGRRFVVDRQEVLTFAAAQALTLGAGGQEDWLYPRQVRVQFPVLPMDTLRYYSRKTVPPLARAVRSRIVERPSGLRCRHRNVHQFSATDVRELVEWLDRRRSESTRASIAGVMSSASNATKRSTGASRLRVEDRPEPYMAKLIEIREAIQEAPQQTAEMVHRKIIETPAAVETPTNARGRWLYEQRLAGQSWKNIVAELARLAPMRGWETLTDEPTASTTLRRWCKKINKPYPVI